MNMEVTTKQCYKWSARKKKKWKSTNFKSGMKAFQNFILMKWSALRRLQKKEKGMLKTCTERI